MAHGVTEATEVTQCHGGADSTKTDGGVAYSFLITLDVNTLNRKCLIELANISVAQCTNGASVTSIALF